MRLTIFLKEELFYDLDGKCPAETTSDTKGQFQWKPVFPAEISTVPCSGNSGASATRIW